MPDREAYAAWLQIGGVEKSARGGRSHCAGTRLVALE